MIGPQHSPLALQKFRLDFLGFRVSLFVRERRSQVSHQRKRVDVVLALRAFQDAESLSLQFLRIRLAVFVFIIPRKIGHGFHCIHIVVAQNAAPCRQGGFQEFLPFAVKAKIHVDVAHHLHHLCLQFGIAGQPGAHLLGSLVQNFARRHAVAAGLAGIRNAEHAGHEVRDAIGAIAFAGDPPHLHRLHHSESRKQQHQHRGNSHAHAISAHVFLHAINSARRPRKHGLILQIALQVSGQFTRASHSGGRGPFRAPSSRSNRGRREVG